MTAPGAQKPGAVAYLGGDVPRITLSDGRWMDLRLPTTDQFLAMLDPDDPQADMAGVRRIRAVRDSMDDACIGTSWGGRPGDLPVPVIMKAVGPWLDSAEDDALPPASGTGSGTTSPGQGSAAAGE